MARPPISLDEGRIFDLYTQGLAFSKIGQELGVDGGTIRNRVIRMGLSTRRSRPSPTKGKPWSAETRAKHMAYRQTDEYREACAERQRGEKGNNWKGGNIEQRSPRGWEWKQTRRKVYERDGWTCQECGVRCLNAEHARWQPHRRIQAHHILPRRFGGTDDLDNLITLCLRCHGRIEGLSLTRKGLMARYISKYKAFKKGAVKPTETLIQTPQGPRVELTGRGIIAMFEQGGAAPWEVAAAQARFAFTGLSEQENPLRRISVYDTDQHARTEGWTPAVKAEVERVLDAGQNSDYFRVDPPKVTAPWPSYDELTVHGRRTSDMVAEQNLATAAATGIGVEHLIRYETQERGDAKILAAYEKALAEADKAERADEVPVAA